MQTLLEVGDRIGIWSSNHVEWIETQFAAAKAGLILVNINPAYKSEELAYVTKLCGISAIVSDTIYKGHNYSQIIQDTLKNNSDIGLKFVAFRGQCFNQIAGIRTFSFDELRKEQDSNFMRLTEEQIKRSDMD